MPEAEVTIRQVLAVDPNHVDGLHLLGLIAARVGRYDAAVELIGRAAAIKPDFAEAHYNLGRAFRDQGKLEAAVTCYRRAIALNPNDAEANNNLGFVLERLGRLDEAAACCERALVIKPDFAEAHVNLGNSLLQQGKSAEAEARYYRALAFKPDFPEAHLNLGNLHRDKGNLEDAVTCYRRAIAARPDYVDALNNLGVALREQGTPDDAAACYRRALQFKPDFAEAHGNLATALWDQGRLEDAAACVRNALAIKPDHPPALDLLVQLRRYTCDWDGIDADIARVFDLVEQKGEAIDPFIVLGLSQSPELHLVNAQRWAKKNVVGAERRFSHPRPATERRIRLGYLSADFHANATAYLTAELFERHDRLRFEVAGYSLGPNDGSKMRRRLEAGFDRFVDLRALSHAAAAERIHGDGIDILVDLKGYTRHARPGILACRPAPIQVNWLGYPGSMGADFMDYIIVDRFVVPPEQQKFFTEKLVHLPHCYQSNDTQRRIAEATPSRAECGLPEEAFVFCCFNNAYKITPRFFAIWMRLLAALPGSVLWLLGEEAVKRNLSREAAARGVDPARLVFARHLPLAEHLARHRRADLFLDTLPVNAHTTASDALWAGLPLLTLAGESFPGRVAGSLLRAVGLPELVTASEEDYEALALRLATDPALLGQCRQLLAENRATAALFDTAGFTRDIESAFDLMWRRWRDGEPPAAFAVPAAGSDGEGSMTPDTAQPRHTEACR